MLYLILSTLSFGCGFGLMHYTDRVSLPAKKESLMFGAGISMIIVGAILVVYGMEVVVVDMVRGL